MQRQSLARGLETRIANKHKRRDHIVACAGKIIAEDGLEAFTIARLAEQADVTIPTVHNLLGKRADILDTLVDKTMSEVMAAAATVAVARAAAAAWAVSTDSAVRERPVAWVAWTVSPAHRN